MAATPLQILLEDAFVDVVVGSTPTTGPFTFDFPFFSETDDIKVKRTDDATGAVTTLAVTTDYTVSGVAVSGGFQGGTITLVSSDSDATLTIYRDVSIKRTDWFPSSGPFDITTLNQTLARIFAIAQEVNESIARGLKLDITEAGTELTLPAQAARSSKFLAFDASGLPIASDAVGAGTVVSAFAETMLDDADGAAVLTTLGVNASRAQALGDASTKTVGVANGNVIAADATGLPVIDGSQLTGLPVVSTGDVRLTFKTTADTGWVMMDDGSIGSASSGASNRANADTEPLYTLLWDNVSDTYAPVSSGRGASAAADFAANKTLTLPAALGRALGLSGAGSGLTSRSLGEGVGAETHQLTEAEMPSHTHADLKGSGGAGTNAPDYTLNGTGNGGNIQSTGGDTAHNNMQPTVFINAMVKL